MSHWRRVWLTVSLPLAIVLAVAIWSLAAVLIWAYGDRECVFPER